VVATADRPLTEAMSVHALFGGMVRYAGCATEGFAHYGRIAYVETSLDGDTYGVLYAHLSSLAPGIASGSSVAAGQALGAFGGSISTGSGGDWTCDAFDAAGGVHLHFAVYQDAVFCDPRRADGPPNGCRNDGIGPHDGRAVIPEPLVGVTSYEDLATYTGDLTAAPAAEDLPTGPGDPAAVMRLPTALPLRLPWPTGTKARVTAGYGEGVVPGHWASVRFGLGQGTPVIAATVGDVLYAGPATGRFAGLGNIVVEQRRVGDHDYQLLYTGLATVEPPVSFIDPDHVIGTAGPDGLGFAVYRDAILLEGTDTGLVGGTPVYPEPLLGAGLYEHLAWWRGPMSATSVTTDVGDPGGSWARGSTRDGGHVAFRDTVDLVARVRGTVELREVRFTAYYQDWADPKDAAKLEGFDPKRHWRILAVCRPKGVDGEPRSTTGCDWEGSAREAVVTYHWDPTKAEAKASVPWLPRADAAITAKARTCTKVRLSFDLYDVSGYRHLAPDGLRAVEGCGTGAVGGIASVAGSDAARGTVQEAEGRGDGRLVYLDPLGPPEAPAGVRHHLFWRSIICSGPGPCEFPYRISWSGVPGAIGYRVYAQNVWLRGGAGCPGMTSGLTRPQLLATVRDGTEWHGRFTEEWRGETLINGSRYYVVAYNRAGESRRAFARSDEDDNTRIIYTDPPECIG
jgi:murein DD-endopeptidase MepM/ murein hydrolase activator NlpD